MRIRKKSGFRSPKEQQEFRNGGEDDFFGLLSPAIPPSHPSAAESENFPDREDCAPYDDFEAPKERAATVFPQTEDTDVGRQRVSLSVKASGAGSIGKEADDLWSLYRRYGEQREEHIAEFGLSPSHPSCKMTLREGDYLLRQTDSSEASHGAKPVRFRVATEGGVPAPVLSDMSDHRVVLRCVDGQTDYLLTIGQQPPHAVLLVRVVDPARRCLTGAAFELKSGDGRIQHIVPDADVFSGRIHLLEGTYTLEEKTPPSGFSGMDPIRLDVSLADGGILLRERGNLHETATLVRLPEMESVYLLTVTNVPYRDSSGVAALDEPVPAVLTQRNNALLTQNRQNRTILPVNVQDTNVRSAASPAQTVLGVQEADDADVPMKCFRIQYGDFFGAPIAGALFRLRGETGDCQLVEMSCCGRSSLLCRGLGCFVLTQIQTPCGFLPMRVRFCIVRCANCPDNARIVLADDTPFVTVTNNRCDRRQNANLILNARSENCGNGGF